MKKLTHVLSLSAILFAAIIITSGCKKKEETPAPTVPAFTMTATTVNLVGGGFGLQFFAKCNNDDVKMTKVMITDPIASFTETYNLNGTYFVKNEIFGLQATDVAYTKSAGTWKFNFVGNRTADGTAFAVDVTLAISK
ncbi:MAG: hypothetical protein WCK09_22495 [Bacteroidota bacterium]